MSIKNTSVQLAVNLVEPYKDVNCLVFELMNVARRYDTTPTATFDFTLPKPDRSIIWKAWVETPCQNVFTELSAKNPNHNDKPAETKDQVIHDAKIQIENMMRRLRVLNVEENIRAVLELQVDEQGKRLSKSAIEQRLNALLHDLSIEKLRTSPALALSGGERRRVEIARALVTDPKFLLLDEPFTGIDPISLGELQEMIGYLKERGIGVLITDHNVRETLSIVDHAYIVNEGEVLIDGDSRTILDSAAARKLYLGDKFYP